MELSFVSSLAEGVGAQSPLGKRGERRHVDIRVDAVLVDRRGEIRVPAIAELLRSASVADQEILATVDSDLRQVAGVEVLVLVVTNDNQRCGAKLLQFLLQAIESGPNPRVAFVDVLIRLLSDSQVGRRGATIAPCIRLSVILPSLVPMIGVAESKGVRRGHSSDYFAH